MMNRNEVTNFILSIHKSTETLHGHKRLHWDEMVLGDADLDRLNDVVKWATEIVQNEVELR